MTSALAAALGCEGDAPFPRAGSAHVLMAVRPSGAGPIVMAASDLTEMAYDVALRACLVQLRGA